MPETTTVSGTVAAPAVDDSHTNPDNVNITNPKNAGTFNSSVSSWINNGNVPLTVTIAAVNPTGCTINSLTFQGGGTSVTLNPGESKSANFSVELPSLPAGGSNQPFGFDIESTWVVA